MRIAPVGEVLPLVDPLPLRLAADFHPFQLFRIGEVDIEAGERRQPFFQYLPGYLADVRPRRLEVGIRLVTAQRKADRRNAFQTTFDNDTHRTGIMHVDRRIVAMIDAAHHEVRLTVEYRM